MDKIIKILMIFIVLGLTSYVGYDQLEKRHKKRLDAVLEYEQRQWQEKTEKLEEKIASLQEELSLQRDELVPKEKLLEVFGEDSPGISPGQEEVSCEELERQITTLFSYLDKKEYMKSYELEGGTYDLFQQIIKQLSGKPPIVTGEMKDLSSLMRNMAHLYRILGRKRIELIKEILKNESEVAESVMAIFYAWFNSGDRCEEKIKGCPSLEFLYEYTGFFLSTLAGKSYLMRRDSKVRILTSYYCVLILDRSSEETLNQYGIDIRPYIDFLFYDILNQRGLIYKKQYLEKLVGLKEKYRR
jgi:hypothetical protein